MSKRPTDRPPKRSGGRTATSSFGAGRREGHDATEFYARFASPKLSDDETVVRPQSLLDELGSGRVFVGSSAEMSHLPDNSVALVVTSPPYFVGKEYELAVAEGAGSGQADRDASREGSGEGTSEGIAGDPEQGRPGIPATYVEFLDMLRSVFAECARVLEPGGRIAVNIANLGRKPYRSLSADVVTILQDDLGLLLRGEVLWEKSETSSGSCAWGSFAKASNPVLRDMTERVVIASKGRFARAIPAPKREAAGLPHRSTITNDEFVEVTRDVWRMDPESASRIGHPAPFPIDLPRRLIDLYTYEGDIVLDPFAGSGTTLVAAARTGRIGVGYDTDADYAELAESRVQAELEALEGAAELRDSLQDPDPEVRAYALEKLSHAERAEHYLSQAVAEGKKVSDIAIERLTEAGFEEILGNHRHPGGALDVDMSVNTAVGAEWPVELAGSFTSARPGLQRIDQALRMLGRLSLMNAPAAARGSGSSADDAAPADPPAPLVLTPLCPPKGSPADRALHAAGPSVIFDVIELYDPASLRRLAEYAGAADPEPLPGFWEPDDLAT